MSYNGDALARKLAPAIGDSDAIRVTCARICRAATSLHRLNEDECNGHPLQGQPGPSMIVHPDAHRAHWARVSQLQAEWEARVEREQAVTLARLERLVSDLPATDVGPFKFEAECDPRGCSLIIVPEGCGINGDSFGSTNGVCVPTSR